MKKKREHTGCAAKLAAAKTAGCGGGKTAEGRPRGGVVLPKTEGETAIADIFGAISKKPQKNSNRNRSNQNNTSGSIQHTAGGTPPKLCGDGLYRAPEKTLELSDTVFFDVASRRHGRDRNKSSDVVAVMGVGREGGELLRREGVSRIVTMEELRKITSSNPKAGGMEYTQPLRHLPARRSLKFQAGEQARHFLAFDPSISKYDRMIFYMELFAQVHSLVDATVIPHFSPPKYLPEQYVELRVLTDPRHPAYGQIGLFAKRTIPSNTVVTPYSGYVEIFSTSCSSRTYTMGFGSVGDDYVLDAEFVGNYGRFANDPRGIEGFSANLTAESRFTPRGEAYTALVSKRIINKGEEILMSYGKAHNLRPNAWVGLKGELLTRHRAGGIVPFPQLAKKKRYDRNNCLLRSKVNSNGLSESPSCGHGGGETPPVQQETLIEKFPTCEDGDAEIQLLWECPQCGIWSIGSPTPVLIDHCFFCQSPRPQRSRMVAIYCTTPLTREDVLASVVRDVTRVPPPLTGDSSPDMVVVEKNTMEGSTPQSPAILASDEGFTQPSAAAVAAAFSSEVIDWPLNVPFLSWQVWDAAIPLFTVGKHARFETHENIFLYNVTTASEEDSQQLNGVRRVRDGNGDDGVEDEEGEASQEEQQPRRRGRKPRVRRKKEELWQKEVPNPNESQSHDEGKVTRWRKIDGTGSRNDNNNNSNTTDYLFCIRDEAVFSDGDGSGVRDEDATSSTTAAFLALQSMLKAVTRRVFTGRSYHAGEVVAAVGGLIGPRGDKRKRPDCSVLEIPMEFFMPTYLRHMLRSGRMRTNETEALSDLLRHLESLSLVVTNEFMFCPCLVLQDDGDYGCDHEERVDDDTRVKFSVKDRPKSHPLLEICNVSFVLTSDAMGCPYVAVVALKDINTFEPLLARIGS